MHLSDLPTPSLLIEQSRLERNLRDMQERAAHQNVALRPHTKTHKCIELARRQEALGARGLTVAKLGEAEVFADAGFQDNRLAYALIGEDKYRRFAALQDRIRVSFCVDTMDGARAASAWFSASGREADVLIEVDCGYGRCGVRWDHQDSPSFAAEVDALPGLRVRGILTHAGNSYNGPADETESLEDALRRVSNQERDRMLAFAVSLRNVGVTAAVDGSLEISIGSTPSMRYFENRVADGFRITEIRPGNYVFLDATQVGLGVEPLRHCALTVLATVISRHRNSDGSERLFLDAGKKVFTSDAAFGRTGYGIMLYDARAMEPMPHMTINALSEEHGWVKVGGGSTLRVGDRVRVVPNHACVVVNTQRELILVDGDEVVQTWQVDGQSRVT